MKLLRRYERARKADVLLLGASTDGCSCCLPMTVRRARRCATGA